MSYTAMFFGSSGAMVSFQAVDWNDALANFEDSWVHETSNEWFYGAIRRDVDNTVIYHRGTPNYTVPREWWPPLSGLPNTKPAKLFLLVGGGLAVLGVAVYAASRLGRRRVR